MQDGEETDYSPWMRNTRAAWETAVHAWLSTVGGTVFGPVLTVTVVKERPWSAVHRVTFETAVAYFKACGAAGRHELPLLRYLAQQDSVCVPQILAADETRGWLLLADNGRILRDVLPDAEQIAVFPELLAHYAEVQIASTNHVAWLRSIGLPDRRVSRLPALLEGLLARDTSWVGRSPEAAAALRGTAGGLLPRLREVCEALVGTPYAAALDHGDLHRGNVAIEDGRCTLIDWGDACLTHPFASLLVPLETLLQHVAPAETARWAYRLRDAYLEPWETFAPRQQLQVEFEQALWIGQVVRALNMDHMFQAAPAAVLNQWRPMIFERLHMWCHHHSASRTLSDLHKLA